MKSDLAITTGRHNLKIGIDLKQTRLLENFGFGITDPTFNPVCLDSNGDAGGAAHADRSRAVRAAARAVSANPNLLARACCRSI